MRMEWWLSPRAGWLLSSRQGRGWSRSKRRSNVRSGAAKTWPRFCTTTKCWPEKRRNRFCLKCASLRKNDASHEPENSSSSTEANEGNEEAGTDSWCPCLLTGELRAWFLSSGKRSLRYLCELL